MGPVKVKIKRLSDRAVVPTRGSTSAAGYDLYACLPDGIDSITVRETPLEKMPAFTVSTGWAFEIPEGYFGAIFARSGLAKNAGIRPANCVGVVDSDYRGEVKVAVRNDTWFPANVQNGDRIAQLVVLPYLPVEFVESDMLSDTDRGAGGFGSTGTGVETPEHVAEQLSLFDYDDEGEK